MFALIHTSMYSMHRLRPYERSEQSSPPASRDTSMHPPAQSQMPPSQSFSEQGSQSDKSGLSQIEKGARPRTAEERCSWLRGGNRYIGLESYDCKMECCKFCRRAWPVDGFDNPVTGRIEIFSSAFLYQLMRKRTI